MTPLLGPFAIAAVLLLGAGVAKVVSPDGTVGALAALRLPHRKVLVRAGGGAEAALAAAAWWTGSPTLALVVAVSYLLFAGFVVVALRSGTAVSSCGCLGRLDTPPHPVHVVLDLAAASVALAVVIRGGVPGLPAVLAAEPWGGIPFLLGVGIGAWLASVAMSLLPRTLRAAKGVI